MISEKAIVAIAVSSGFGFELVNGARVVERRTDFHTPSAQVRIQLALRKVEAPFPFIAGLHPTEPVHLAIVGVRTAPAKGVASIVVPVHLCREAELMQLDGTFYALS